MNAQLNSLVCMCMFSYSCMPPAATPEELAAGLACVPFDQKLISDVPRYESLALFIQTHADTLVTMRNTTRMVTFVNGTRDGLHDTTYLVPKDCHTYFEGNDQYDLKPAPPYLHHRLDSLYHQFSKEHISSFEVCQDGRVVIGVRSEKVTETLMAEHQLIWDPKAKPSTSTYIQGKDTLLPSGIIYRIGLVEDRGW